MTARHEVGQRFIQYINHVLYAHELGMVVVTGLETVVECMRLDITILHPYVIPSLEKLYNLNYIVQII